MAINKETRISKTNTFEQWREGTNEISIRLGDTEQLDSRIADFETSHTVSSTSIINYSSTRTEISDGIAIDAVAIILKSNPSIPASFIAGATITQSGGFSARIVSVVGTQKIYVDTVSGTYSASQNLAIGGDSIAAANHSRLLSESFRKGILRVSVQGSEIPQGINATGFHIPTVVGNLVLSGSPTIPASFTEGATLYQGTNLSGATWSGTLAFIVGTTNIYFKTVTGTFDQSKILKVDGNTGASNQIAAGSMPSSIVDVDNSISEFIELNFAPTLGHVILIDSNSLVTAVNEVQDDVGNIASLTTTNKSDIVSSINEIDAELGTITAGAMGTTASTVSAAISELEVEIDTLNTKVEPGQSITTTATTLSDAINEIDAELGTISSGVMGTTASTVGPAIGELEAEIDTLNTFVEPTQSLNTSASTLADAINEHESNIGNMTLTGLAASDISAGLRELASEKIDLVNTGTQTINSNLVFGQSGKTFTFNNGTTLDLSSASLIIGGGGSSLTFNTALIELDGNVNVQGIRVDRQHVGGGSEPDVTLQWNEGVVGTKPARAWQVVGLNDSSTTNTADLVTYYNAKDLISNNTESNITVAWDSTNQNFDFSLNDTAVTANTYGSATAVPVITIDAQGRITGATTAAVSSTFDLDGDTGGSESVDLLTDTLKVLGTANEINTVVSSVGTNKIITVSLPDDVTIGDDLTVTDTLSTGGLATLHSATVTNNLSVGGNAVITGNLTVSGATVTIEASTLSTTDNIIVLNSDVTGSPTEPGGIEIERGSSTNAVLQWNETGDYWEAGTAGSLSELITEATDYDSWTVTGDSGTQTITNTTTLDFEGGTGISTAASGSGKVTITNTDLGSSQNIFKTIAVSGQSDIVADSNSDTLTLVGGNAITITNTAATDTITIAHDDTSSISGTFGQASTEDGQYIKSITIDSNGHLTAITTDDFDDRYDNYGSWSIAASGTAGQSLVQSGDQVTFTGTNQATVTRSGDNITIDVPVPTATRIREDSGTFRSGDLTLQSGTNVTITEPSTGVFNIASTDTNTQRTDEEIQDIVGAMFSGTGASTVTYNDAAGTIVVNSTDTNTDTNTVTRIQGQSGSPSLNSGDFTFNGSGATTVSQSGNTITINSTDTNTDTNTTNFNIQADSGPSENISAGETINFLSGGATSVTRSGNNVTFTSTDTNSTYTAGSFFSASAPNIQGKLSALGVGTNASGTSGEIRATNDITAFYSDDRLKTRLSGIENALDKVDSLSGFIYEPNERAIELGYQKEERVGVSAQEVEAVTTSCKRCTN